MTARYLMTLALALGMGGVVGCSGDTTTKDTNPTGDDDDTTGDDDDDTTPTADTSDQTDVMIPAQMTISSQFGVLGGALVDAVNYNGGTFGNAVFVNIGPEDWDPNDSNDDNYCTIFATLTDPSLGMLDAEPVIAPYVDAGDPAEVDNDCAYYFTLPADFDPNSLVSDFPGWSVGVASALSTTMQDNLDASVDPAYADYFFGGYMYLPILKEPLWETFYAIGYGLDGSANLLVDTPILRPDVSGQSELPDGFYIIDALVIVTFQ